MIGSLNKNNGNTCGLTEYMSKIYENNRTKFGRREMRGFYRKALTH